MTALEKVSCYLVLAGMCGVAAAAQTSVPPYGSQYPNATATRQGRKGEPCWKQVGISQSINQERKQIEESTHSQMEAVCHNSSLSAQQKEQQLQQLRTQSRQKIASLVGAQQEQALRACREQRGETGHGHSDPEKMCSASVARR
jgi:hypothetical protein